MSADRNIVDIMRQQHRETHPHCTYGDEPHYVPPSLGDPGFFMCDARVVQVEPYADPIFLTGMIVADLQTLSDDRRTWCFVGGASFVASWKADLERLLLRSDLPARLGVVDPATGRLNRDHH